MKNKHIFTQLKVPKLTFFTKSVIYLYKFTLKSQFDSDSKIYVGKIRRIKIEFIFIGKHY